MEDRDIIELFFNRDEQAIKEAQDKYENACFSLAVRILNSDEDSYEAVNDTFLKAWNTIPPKNPQKLSSYLLMLCRGISIDILRHKSSAKRGGGEYEMSLEELDWCIPDRLRQSEIDCSGLTEAINSFLSELNEKKRIIFMRRYWWINTVSEIAEDMNISESKVKMILLRTREKLRDYLEKEGFDI